jgi:hypothetical protein
MLRGAGVHEVASVYLECATITARLLAGPEVAANWSKPSALSEFAVSGLAGHLAWQITSVPGQLQQQPPAGSEIVPVLDHYGRVRWVNAPLDDEFNVNARRSGDAEAAGGSVILAQRAMGAAAELRNLLQAEAPGRPVYLPWNGWSLTLEDFLITRIVEVVIHIDDLAVSIQITPPALPDEATETVLDLLTRLAARRHGTAAVLRALSRQERAPATISAF